MRKLVKLLLLMVLLGPLASAVSVGVSPGFIDLGRVQPGSTHEINFYITTNSQDEFQVDPSYEFSLSYTSVNGGPINIANVSEQEIDSWISWTQDKYTIDPDTTETYNLPDGTAVSAEGVVTMKVDVPANTEPGYRIGDINLDPSISGSGGSAGAVVIGQTQPSFAFRVPGNVRRDIDVTGVQAVRIGENKVQVIAELRNTGTITTRLGAMKAGVYDENGRNVGSLIFDEAKMAPGEQAEVDAIWSSSQVEGGEYRVEGTGSYDHTSGETLISSQFAITNVIEERQSIDNPSGGETEKAGVPILMIVIVSMLLGTLLYLMEVELTWLIMITGGTAVSLFILLGTTSNVLVLIPLASIGIMLYI